LYLTRAIIEPEEEPFMPTDAPTHRAGFLVACDSLAKVEPVAVRRFRQITFLGGSKEAPEQNYGIPKQEIMANMCVLVL
jgi:hypothetical protein